MRTERALVLAALCLSAGAASAQLLDDADWREVEVPPPPSYDVKRAVPIDMPSYMTLSYGVDPETVFLTPDGVVRYVLIATSRNGNGFNAVYEGIRCASGEVKTYARSSGQGWNKVESPEWKPVRDVRYSLALAKQAICQERAPRSSIRAILNELKTPSLVRAP